jgi:ABC-type multidrug transport system ATPase subunit
LLVAAGLAIPQVVGPLDFALDAGRLGVVWGPSGSGRSSVLLAASGRLREATGDGRFAHVHLVRDARAVRRRTAVARIADLVDLEPRLTVDESITERALIEGVSVRAAERAVRDLSAAFGVDLPRRSLVEDLSQLDRGRFALALAGVRPAELVVFDDVDRGLDPGDQARLYAALLQVAAGGPAVLASTTAVEAVPADAVLIDLLDHAASTRDVAPDQNPEAPDQSPDAPDQNPEED